MAHDVVVIGASSGGVQPLIKIVAALPADLPAAVFVVMHVRPDMPSQLPAILNRAGRLPAAHAVDGEPIRRSRIYVAPPAMQTYVHQGRISVRRGPHENSNRPAVDPLFRTAAHHYGPRVVAIVLTGALDDGASGIAAVKSAGGIAMVQDPDEAEFPDMPQNARTRADVDLVLPVDQLAAAIVQSVRGNGRSETLPQEVPLETREEAPPAENAARSQDLGVASGLTCPDCHGALWEIEEGLAVRYRCRVGHAYSEDTIVGAQNASVERALWAALRALEERSALIHKLADNARRRGHESIATMFEQRLRAIDVDVSTLHELIVAGGTLEPVSPEAM